MKESEKQHQHYLNKSGDISACTPRLSAHIFGDFGSKNHNPNFIGLKIDGSECIFLYEKNTCIKIEHEALDAAEKGEAGTLYKNIFVSPDRWEEYCPPATNSMFLSDSAVYAYHTYKELIIGYVQQAIKSATTNQSNSLVLGLPMHLYLHDGCKKLRELLYENLINSEIGITSVGCVPNAFSALAHRNSVKCNECFLYLEETPAFTEAVLLLGGRILWWRISEYLSLPKATDQPLFYRYQDSKGALSYAEESRQDLVSRMMDQAAEAVHANEISLQRIAFVPRDCDIHLPPQLQAVPIDRLSPINLKSKLIQIGLNYLQMKGTLQELDAHIKNSCIDKNAFGKAMREHVAKEFHSSMSCYLSGFFCEKSLFFIPTVKKMLQDPDYLKDIASYAAARYDSCRSMYTEATINHIKKQLCLGKDFDLTFPKVSSKELDTYFQEIAKKFSKKDFQISSEALLNRYAGGYMGFLSMLNFSYDYKYSSGDLAQLKERWDKNQEKVVNKVSSALWDKLSNEEMLSPLSKNLATLYYAELKKQTDDLSLLCVNHTPSSPSPTPQVPKYENDDSYEHYWLDL